MTENEKQFNPEKQTLEVFNSGDIVIFDDSERNQKRLDETTKSAVHELISKYGAGPFNVKSVRDSFGGQMLMIELSDGRVIPMASQWMKRQ